MLLRVTDFLKYRIDEINQQLVWPSIKLGYQGRYQGVFPIKVNQQAEVIDRIAEYGHEYRFGFEVGSKAELLIALSLNLHAETAIICNGIKDSEFLELAIMSLQLGFNTFIVLESPLKNLTGAGCRIWHRYSPPAGDADQANQHC